MPRNPNCTRCPLHHGVKTVCLWGIGPKRADIMLVGEAPGENEDREGEPFIGAAGGHLDDCLERAGLSRDVVYIANAAKCRPPDNRDPTPQELGACFPYLAEEIERVKPKVIVCVGRNALKALTGENAVERNRGRLIDPSPKVHIGNAKIIVTYHPAAFLHSHNKQILDAIVEDLRGAQNLITPITPAVERYILPEGYTSRQLIDALKHLDAATDIACDLEWLAPYGKERISWPWTKGVSQLSMSLTGRVGLKLVTVAFAWPPQPVGRRAIADLFKYHKLVFHNAMADVIWLLAARLKPVVGGDSMLLGYLLDEHRRAGLKGLAPLVAGVEAGWETKPWHRRPQSQRGWRELLEYNAGDTENTLLTHEKMVEQLGALPRERGHNIWRCYKKLILPAVVPFARIALQGTPIDIEALDAEIARHEKLYDEAVNKFAKITGLRKDKAETLANSPAQVKRYIREALGLEIDSTREDALVDYVDQYPTIGVIQTIRHEAKMLNTYLKPWKRLLTAQGDGRLHSVYLLGATRTGRLSAEVEEGGSLLVTPRDGWMRDLIAAPEGYEIHAADYSQLELRVVAWMAPERTMRELYKENADLHATTAAYVKARLPLRKFMRQRKKLVRYIDQGGIITKDDRQAGKSNNFGFVYGMQEEHYASYAKKNYGVALTEEQAHKSRDGFFELYHDLPAWHERSIREAQERGYTLTPFGRYRFGLEPTQAINTPIQSTGSDLTMFALTVIDERLERELEPGDARLVGFIHDSVIVLAKKAVRERVKKIIAETMENPPLERVGIEKIPVPLVAEVLTGQTWAKAA